MAHQFGYASWPMYLQRFICLSLPVFRTGVQTRARVPHFYVGAGEKTDLLMLVWLVLYWINFSPNFTILSPQNFLHILLYHFHFFIKHPTRTSDKMLSSSTGSSCALLAADLRGEAFGPLVFSVVSIVVSSQVSSFHWRKSFLLHGLSIAVGSDSVDVLCLLDDCFNSIVSVFALIMWC